MIEVAQRVRKAYYDLLSGGLNIPVYDELAEDESGENYVILSSQIDTDTSNKSAFESTHTITIDVVTRFNTSARKLPSEQIAEQILNLVLPTPRTTGLVSPNDLQITAVRLEDSQSLPVEQYDTWKVVRKIMRFSQKCVQL